jgi:hypothetical protein
VIDQTESVPEMLRRIVVDTIADGDRLKRGERIYGETRLHFSAKVARSVRSTAGLSPLCQVFDHRAETWSPGKCRNCLRLLIACFPRFRISVFLY